MSSLPYTFDPNDPIQSLGINPNDPRLMSNLIITPVLQGAYKDAGDFEKRESSTVPLWENILNKYMSDDNMAVNSQQPLDETTKAVDIAVGYYDQSWENVFVLLLECKRHKHRDLQDLESQLVAYVQDYFYTSGGGRAKRDVLFGAVAFGTKIRVFLFRNTPDDLEMVPLWGGHKTTKSDVRFYKDPMHDGKEILAALIAAKNLRTNAAGGNR